MLSGVVLAVEGVGGVSRSVSGNTMAGVDADRPAALPAARIGGLGSRDFGGRRKMLRHLVSALRNLSSTLDLNDVVDLNDIVQNFEDVWPRRSRRSPLVNLANRSARSFG